MRRRAEPRPEAAPAAPSGTFVGCEPEAGALVAAEWLRPSSCFRISGGCRGLEP